MLLFRRTDTETDMEKCHTPYHIQRVDYVCHWMEQVVCAYLGRPEREWETIIYGKRCSFCLRILRLIITSSHLLHSQRLVKNNGK